MADVTKINGYIIKDANAPHPSNVGSAGQVLKKTETGTEWADVPTAITDAKIDEICGTTILNAEDVVL